MPTYSSAIGKFVIGRSPIGVFPPFGGHLTKYLQDTQRILNDQTEQKHNRFDLQRYINLARKRVAAESQCIRVLLPSSGSFATVTVSAGGTGYTTPPTVSVTMPDAWGVGFSTAQITVTISGGAVNTATLVVPGSGYINPSVVLSGGGGHGAALSFTLTPFVATIANQETYAFQTYNSLLPEGLSEIFALQNVSVSWGGIKPTMRHTDFSAFQAYYRAYNTQSTNWPAVWAQYGDGTQGTLYLNPIPSQPLQMEWDAYVLPADLDVDWDTELLPFPWTMAVPYYAAWWACMSSQDMDRANYFDALYKRAMKEARSWASVAVFPDFYTPDIA